MHFPILVLLIVIFLSFFSPSVLAEGDSNPGDLTIISKEFGGWAWDEYIGESLWNNIYKRIDEGSYKLKKQLMEKGLEKSAKEINEKVGSICLKDKEKVNCFNPQKNFTPSELDDISNGDLWPIYTHITEDVTTLNTEQAVSIRLIVMEYYQKKKETINDQQKKLQEIGSIGLFSDGDEENSWYDLMVDLENIHRVIFSGEYTYEWTANMGAESIKNLLGDIYINPLDINRLIISPQKDPEVTTISRPPVGTGWITIPWDVLSGIINTGSNCSATGTVSQIPINLDSNFLRDVQSQLLVGTSPQSSITFPDDGKLPEAWAKTAQWKWGSSNSWGGYLDKFPCPGTSFYCILMSQTIYTQNLLSGWTANTIEKILDENLKIANQFVSSSFVQAKMTNMFFQLSLRELDLKAMIHIGAIVSYLPPPILNLKKGTDWGGVSAPQKEDDEFNKILIGTFNKWGLDFKRQNSLEDSSTTAAVVNLNYLTTSDLYQKLNKEGITPITSDFTQAKSMEIKKSYGDSFNDDLFELHGFTATFADSIRILTAIITQMNAIPQK